MYNPPASGHKFRLLTWYSIVTVLFRCPPSLQACDESSPAICKPYFQIKHAVSPHLSPYYETYAAPYVEIAKPYYESFDRTIVTPGRSYAVRYGGPRLAQAQAYSQAQWEKQVQPQLAKYQAIAKDKYDQSLGPHVEKAATALTPYYEVAKTNALQTYHEFVLPTYTFVQPYALQGYDVAYTFTRDTAVPSTIWAWNKTYVFLDSTIWPRLRDVYTATVEPQLVRIGERLGRYNRKTKSAADDVASAMTKPTFKPSPSHTPSTQTSSASVSDSDDQLHSTAVPSGEAANSQDTVAPDVKVGKKKKKGTPEEVKQLAAKTVEEDLELWHSKFSNAVEESATDIEERVDELSARMVEHHSAMGRSLVAQLEDAVASDIPQLKSSILAILEKNQDDKEKLEQEVVEAIRTVGLNIKNKAQDVRTWRQNYEQGTEIAVTKAAQEHFEILQRTRDLAMQQIGMKWAWMDGITYKHWKKYHEMKAQFAELTNDLKLLVTSHPGLLAAQKMGTDIEDEAMALAQDAAEELARLKQVASWKAIARDYSEDFDSDTMKLAAEAVQRQEAEAAEMAGDSAEEVNSATVEDESTPADIEDRAESATYAEVVDGVSPESQPANDESSIEADAAEELISDPESNADDHSEKSNVDANEADPVESLAPHESVGDPEDVQESINESPDGSDSSEDEEAESIAHNSMPSVKPALFGAAAQAVPSRQPILDDDLIEDASSSLSSVASVLQSDLPDHITSAAQSAYTVALANAANQYSSAMSAVSTQISGEPKPTHEELFSSASSAYFGAIAAANSRLSEAFTAASQSIYGTPTSSWFPGSVPVPTVPSLDWERVQSIAQQNFQDSVGWVGQQYEDTKEAISEQYESAKVAIGAAEPTPSTYLEEAEQRAQKLLDQAKHSYYAGIGLAHARYSDFLSSASSAVSEFTDAPTPTDLKGSASSAASVASDSAAKAAGQAGEKVAENWDYVVTQVSLQVYGAPTPVAWYVLCSPTCLIY